MSDLVRHGRPITNTFDLLGVDEVALTDSLGFVLSRCPALLRALVTQLGFTGEFSELEVLVSVQVHHGERGITDLEISIPGRLVAILEAKLGAELPGASQLSKYASVLRETDATDKVLVALTNATRDSAQIALEHVGLPGTRLLHLSWREVRALARVARSSESTNRSKALLDEFIDYLGGIIGMETKWSNMVYVVSLSKATPDGWALSWIDIVEKRHRYFYPVGKRWPSPPNYLGFRYDARLQSIHHVDQVEVIENFREVFSEAPDGPIEPHYCFELGPAIVPPHPVGCGPRVVRAGRVWAMLDTLLTFETISKAMDETDRRTTQD